METNNMDEFTKDKIAGIITNMYDFQASILEQLDDNNDVNGALRDSQIMAGMSWEIYKELKLTATQGAKI